MAPGRQNNCGTNPSRAAVSVRTMLLVELVLA